MSKANFSLSAAAVSSLSSCCRCQSELPDKLMASGPALQCPVPKPFSDMSVCHGHLLWSAEEKMGLVAEMLTALMR